MSIAQIKTKLPAPPQTQDSAVSNYLAALHQVVSGLQAQATQQPQVPTGLTCTPVAGGNVISFTKSASPKFNLYISPTSDRNSNSAQKIDLGGSNVYHHFAGQGGVKYYYWVEGVNTAGVSSGISQPVSGTTLGLTTATSIPAPTSASYGKVHDTLSNQIRPIDFQTDQIPEGKRP